MRQIVQDERLTNRRIITARPTFSLVVDLQQFVHDKTTENGDPIAGTKKYHGSDRKLPA
jgi:hypothetical protein